MIKKVWTDTTKQWRHIVSHLSTQKQKRIKDRVTKNILDHLPDNIYSVLDWGCGGGLISKLFSDKGYVVYVVDLIQDSLDSAVNYASNIQFQQLLPEDPDKIYYKGPKPKLIFCNEVIQHFPSYEYFIKILSIWTEQIKPEYIAIQVKLNEKTKQAQDYEKNYLNGLLFNEDDLLKNFSNKGYKVSVTNYSETLAGIPMGYYIFKKL